MAAAALFCIYRFVHFWSSPTCSQKESCILCGLERGEYGEHDWTHTGDCDAPAVCSICGRQQDQAAGHSWTGGSCTEPGVCGICGQTQEQPRGHLYVDGVCTDCGAEQEDRILRTWPNEGHNVESIWDPLEHSLEVRDASLHNFSKMDIVIRDYRKQALSDDRYTLARTDDSVKLNLPRDLEPGRYVLHAGVQETKVMDFWYGSCDSWMPEEADIWLSDFVLQSQAHGLYLTRSQEDIRLLGVPDPENAARFGTPWQICNVQYGADGSPQPVQGSQNQVFVVDTYVMHTQSADPYLLDQTTAHVLHYNGLHLAMDSAGTVYLTDTLDADCFWTISSGLQ